MASKQENDDINTLKTDVAIIKLEQKNQGRALVAINQKLDNLSFVSQKDHDRDQHDQSVINEDVETRLKAVEAMVNAGGVKIANLLNSGATKAIVAILVVAIIGAIIFFGIRLYPAVGGQ